MSLTTAQMEYVRSFHKAQAQQAERLAATDPAKVGIKFDAGKPRWGLLPRREIAEVVQILTEGAVKYADNNWQKVEPRSRYIDAMDRHWNAWMMGQKQDPESGHNHLAHAMCNLLFLLWFDNEEKKP